MERKEFSMKKILLLIALAGLIIAGSVVIAEEPFIVKCCLKGKCDRMTRPECKAAGGRIVGNCGQCK
jgi:hypothetical protein